MIQRHTSQCSTGSGELALGGKSTARSVEVTVASKRRLIDSVVGVVVVDPLAVDRSLAAAEGDVDVFGPDALDLLEKVDIGAQLEQRARLRRSGELGVRDLVVVGTEVTWAVDPEQKVSVAPPRAVEEGGLVDDVVAALDGLARQPNLLEQVVRRFIG